MSERYLGTAGHGGYPVYVRGNHVIVRGGGFEWDHSIEEWRRGATARTTTLGKEVNNLINLEFGPDR